MDKRAITLCENVTPELRPQVETLAQAVYTLQDKIIQQIPIYNDLPLAQEVTVGTGETMLRQNPAAQEFRAIVRDYASTLNTLKSLIGVTEVDEPTALADIKERFKLA